MMRSRLAATAITDHNGDDFLCDKSCGPAHGWWGYVRSEIIREDD